MIETSVDCPYCGEAIDVLVDRQEVGDRYIEDCQVCCRPIVFVVAREPDGELLLSVQTEDEAH